MSGWGFGSLWGGQAAKKKDAPKNAILELRGTLDMLTKREKHLTNQMDEQDNVARKNVTANKKLAMAALRRKKAYEHQLEQTSAQMLTVEREISSIETANINKETLNAMKNASAAMKDIHGGFTVDKVDETMQELADQHAIAEEISEALTQPGMADAADEMDLEKELEDMEQEQLDDRMKETSVPVHDGLSRLPNVANTPVTSHKSREEEEEEELRKLQAEMAM
ncbi:Snf7-domain-containing protein [Polychaeton citri CBS 116435]|uniref:Vacuolar-sorting protein SNF7 n=1 Tax=Polychaeton citri CBS 116435 TaxID=1314669 RepID=A0A9P4UP69_9PEZI|nr:Snf7-domain-containing protein [Polychaeton citri CBS 116435]